MLTEGSIFADANILISCHHGDQASLADPYLSLRAYTCHIVYDTCRKTERKESTGDALFVQFDFDSIRPSFLLAVLYWGTFNSISIRTRILLYQVPGTQYSPQNEHEERGERRLFRLRKKTPQVRTYVRYVCMLMLLVILDYSRRQFCTW